MELITAEELSELLRLSRHRVLVMARRGDIPAFMIDGRLRFDAKEIEAWLVARRHNSLAPKLPSAGAHD